MAEETEDDDEDGSRRHQKNKSKRPYVSAEQSYMQKLYMWHSTKVELLLKPIIPKRCKGIRGMGAMGKGNYDGIRSIANDGNLGIS